MKPDRDARRLADRRGLDDLPEAAGLVRIEQDIIRCAGADDVAGVLQRIGAFVQRDRDRL